MHRLAQQAQHRKLWLSLVQLQRVTGKQAGRVWMAQGQAQLVRRARRGSGLRVLQLHRVAQQDRQVQHTLQPLTVPRLRL
jgi:hypothetical protein